MRVEVIKQGPYGYTLDDKAPSVNEALPLDTVRVTPLVAGPDGVAAVGDMNPHWYLCDDSGSCLLRADAAALPECEFEFLVPDEACSVPGAGSLDLKLGDFFATDEPDAIFAINRAPTVGFVASTDEGPGTQGCLRGIDERTSLEGCLWMERTLSLGSLGEVVDGLTALGYDVEISDSLAPLLGVPRNHNPSVRTLTLSIDGGEPTRFEAGATVSIPLGATIDLEYEPDEVDVDRYTVELDGAPVEVEDRLEGRWFASREVASLEQESLLRTAVLRATTPEPVTLYFVVRDDRRAEAWGWLHLQPE